MKQQLFPTALIKQDTNSVTVGEHNNPKYAYINGYYEAAKILVKEAHNSNSKDILFYPICFNYRHYLELHLKSLIELAEELYSKMETLGYAKDILDKSSEDPLDSVHSIQKLFCYFEKRLKLVAINDEIFNPNIRKYIMEFHNIDSDGQKFRYHITKKQQLSFPSPQEYDLKNIETIMQEIKMLLYGVDGWLEHYGEMSDSIIEEMNEYQKDNNR